MLEFVSGIVASAKEKFADAKSFLQGLFEGQVRHGVFDNDGITNIFPNVGILSVDIIRDKTVASHPLEINVYQQDNIVVNPVIITITLAAESEEVDNLYNTLEQLYASDTVLLSVMCDNRLYTNMVLQSLPIRRDPSKYDLLEVPIVLHEFIYRRARVTLMSSPENVDLAEYSDRQKAGLVQPQTVSGADEISVQAQKTVVPGSTN